MSCSKTTVAADGILEVHWTFPPTTGGVESHLSDLAAALAREGRRVVVLTGEAAPSGDPSYTVVSTSLLELESVKRGDLTDQDRCARLVTELSHLVRKHRIGTIHGHNLHHFHPAAALAIEAVRHQHDLKVLHTFHETWPDLLADSPVYRSWDRNFSVSRHVQRQCEALLGFKPDLLPLCIDTGAFRPLSECFRSDAAPVILHPARLLPWKGVDVGLAALRTLLDRGLDVTLVITDTQRIADWNDELVTYRQQMVDLIRQLRLQGHVRFQSAAYADMPALYAASDIVIYPTIGEEPYGLVPLEAMSCGRPVVGTLSGGISETIVDGVTGFLVPKSDPQPLADRLEVLISDPDSARRMGAAGRRRVLEQFDSAQYVSALLATEA